MNPHELSPYKQNLLPPFCFEKFFFFLFSLGRIDTRDSVEMQLDHARDMIRLCRSDNMGIREFVPFLMLRTDRDQKCYDFVKWYFTTGSKPDYDWGNMDLRFLDVKDASAFEDIMNLGLRGFCKLSHVVALTLLKAKMLLDLNTLESATDVVPRLNDMPRELFDSVRSLIPRSPILSRVLALLHCAHDQPALLGHLVRPAVASRTTASHLLMWEPR